MFTLWTEQNWLNSERTYSSWLPKSIIPVTAHSTPSLEPAIDTWATSVNPLISQPIPFCELYVEYSTKRPHIGITSDTYMAMEHSDGALDRSRTSGF
jgi:hypothetical protein